jgi:hypothetical protein
MVSAKIMKVVIIYELSYDPIIEDNQQSLPNESSYKMVLGVLFGSAGCCLFVLLRSAVWFGQGAFGCCWCFGCLFVARVGAAVLCCSCLLLCCCFLGWPCGCLGL